MKSPTKRFSDRVENYVRFRPSYPPEVIGVLESECGLSMNSRVADIGSGTGILSKLLLDRGYAVVGVEPNREMREASTGIRTPETLQPTRVQWRCGVPVYNKRLPRETWCMSDTLSMIRYLTTDDYHVYAVIRMEALTTEPDAFGERVESARSLASRI